MGSAVKTKGVPTKFGGFTNHSTPKHMLPSECQTTKKQNSKTEDLVVPRSRITSAKNRPGSGVSRAMMNQKRAEIESGIDKDISEENSDESSSEDEKVDVADDKSESSDEQEGYVNKYTLIYPSHRNTEEEYAPYMDYAQMCYEQFTGSYSRKNREKREEEK